MNHLQNWKHYNEKLKSFVWSKETNFESSERDDIKDIIEGYLSIKTDLERIPEIKIGRYSRNPKSYKYNMIEGGNEVIYLNYLIDDELIPELKDRIEQISDDDIVIKKYYSKTEIMKKKLHTYYRAISNMKGQLDNIKYFININTKNTALRDPVEGQIEDWDWKGLDKLENWKNISVSNILYDSEGDIEMNFWASMGNGKFKTKKLKITLPIDITQYNSGKFYIKVEDVSKKSKHLIFFDIDHLNNDKNDGEELAYRLILGLDDILDDLKIKDEEPKKSLMNRFIDFFDRRPR